jgi:CubicO group peptidase (beta-lactamase class C family)
MASALLLCFALGAAGSPVLAAPAHSGATPAAHALTPADLESFFAGLVPYAIERGDIAGATISVVHDGRLVFAHGYGYADVKTRRPVVADRTLFRIGSISKLFTWTSVMQLVQAGKINLDANVNQYLDFAIPERFGKPITMRDLMTHTAGFQETIRDLFVQSEGKLVPLHDYLVTHLPPAIFPPGKVVAYSNYGATLAAYIVQRVSGEPFEQYVQRHILTPLGMTHSTFLQPLPARLRPDMSTGYSSASNPKTTPFEWVQVWPAGSFTSTATDMAKFMIAQLQNGSYHGVQILNPATARLMHSRQYVAVPGLLNGMDLGFYQENRNGHEIIGHAGDTDAFHSDLHLILDANTGLFISLNSAGKEGASETVRVAIFRAFLNRYYPWTAPSETTVAHPKTDAARVAGYYLSSRREDTGLPIFWRLQQAHVTAHPDGTITVNVFRTLSGEPVVWREVGPLDYRNVNGQTHLRFGTDASGKVVDFASDDDIPVEMYQRVGGLIAQGTATLVAGATIAIFVLALLIWFFSWLARTYFGIAFEMTPRQRWLRVGSRIGILAFLAVIYGWVQGLQAAVGAGMFNLDPTLTKLYVVGVIAIIGGVVIVAHAVSRVLTGPGGVLSRAGEVLVGLGAVYGIWAIFAYGLATFNYHY